MAGDPDAGLRVGVGQYFSPHRTSDGLRFNSWAITGDLRVPLGPHLVFTSNVYRGAGLGGLGGGGYVDYIRTNGNAKPLTDAGGWMQAAFKRSERLQLNGGFGIDSPSAANIRSATIAAGSFYPGLLKNRAIFGNVIVSPSRYLQLSLEYRRLRSNFQTGPARTADVLGVAAGCRF